MGIVDIYKGMGVCKNLPPRRLRLPRSFRSSPRGSRAPRTFGGGGLRGGEAGSAGAEEAKYSAGYTNDV